MVDDLTPEQKAQYLYELKRREAERRHDQFESSLARSNDWATKTSEVAIRSALLINGGAAVSVLAFIGGLVGQGKVTVKQLGEVSGSLLWFASGVALAVAALAFAYVTHYAHGSLIQSRVRTWDHPYSQDTSQTRTWSRVSSAVHVAAVVVASMALGAFILGMMDVRAAIVRLGQ
jgi:Kef-type K+ transport system membrane component KefB